MSTSDLKQQLDTLRTQLANHEPLTEAQAEELKALAEAIDQRLAADGTDQTHHSLAEELTIAAERFDYHYPKTAATLRSLIQTLGNMGI